MATTLLHEKARSCCSKLPNCASSKSCKRCKEGMVARYHEVVNYLLKTWATGNVIAKMNAKILQFTQASKARRKGVCRGSAEKGAPLWPFLRWMSPNGIFIEEIYGPIRHRMRSNWSLTKKHTVSKLVSHATFLTNLQHGSPSTEYLNSTNKPSSHCENTTDWRETKKSTTSAHVDEESTSSAPRQLQQMT